MEKNKAVAIYAEGKQHAVAVGFTRLSTGEMYAFVGSLWCPDSASSRSITKDIGVDCISHVGDGLFKTDKID